MLNLELYRIFKVVADEQNLTRASEILNISQPAVTKHIHNLENELQLTLFKRAKYGMELTEDGKKLYNQIKDTMNILMNAENSIKEETTINLCVQVNLPTNLCRNIINKVKEHNPNLEINIIKSYTEHVFEELEKQEKDAFLSKKQDLKLHSRNIDFIKIGDLSDVFVVKNNSQYKIDNLKWEDLNNKTIYTLRDISITSKNLVNILNENGVKNYSIKNTTFSTINEEFENGNDIIAYVTKEYIEKEINEGKIEILDFEYDAKLLDLGVYYNTENKIKNIKRIFRDIQG